VAYFKHKLTRRRRADRVVDRKLPNDALGSLRSTCVCLVYLVAFYVFLSGKPLVNNQVGLIFFVI
jgi:hypothetical protein